MFSTALPIFAAIRIELRQASGLKRGEWFKYLIVATILTAAVALALLIWSTYLPAGVLFIASGVLVLGVLFATDPAKHATSEPLKSEPDETAAN